jgi:deoxyribonuclease V
MKSNVNVKTLREIQKAILEEPPVPIIDVIPEEVVGLDCTYSNEIGLGVAVLFHREKGVLETTEFFARVHFPYIPTYLSFREVPLLLGALRRLSRHPPLMLVDGQGRLHPRRCGLATHISKLTRIPAVGVAKKLLVGEHAKVGKEVGDLSYVYHEGERIGAAVRTSKKANPVYVSVGDGISLERAVETVLAFSSNYKLPEPIRIAHRIAYEKRKELPRN